MIRKLVVILLSSIICLLGVVPALAQGQYSTLGEYEKVTGKTIETFSEAPMLKTKVATGELLPVKQRLPEDFVVIEPLEEIGQYGGTARVFSIAPGHPGDGAYISGQEPILRVASDLKTTIPNIARKWELSEDGKTLTLYLRKGMKWSDGYPFTADDIMYWWEDMVLNDELTPVKPVQYWAPGGELMKVEKVDDYTVRFRFAAPYPNVPMLLSGPEGFWKAQYPKHYLSQFHIKYNSKANELAKERGFDFWHQLHIEMTLNWCSLMRYPDVPTINAFKCVERTASHLLYERNPYYWKVDTEGNQLPYIDRILVKKVEDIEMYTAKIVTGEADFAARETSLENYPLYVESAEKAGYRVLPWPSGFGTMVLYQLNLTCKDPVLREIFLDVRFRRAMSLALNREEINEILFFGMGKPGQWTLISKSILYEPRFAQAYAQYDPEEANRLLDEMGLEWDRKHEYRLRPDGKRLVWTNEYYPGGMNIAGEATSELAVRYWKEIGCQVLLKPITGELSLQRAAANEIYMNLWIGDRGTDMAFFTGDLKWFVPMNTGWEMSYGVEWARWYQSEGKAGEEPPEKVKQIYEWRQELLATMDEEERILMGKNILASQAENVWAIGTVAEVPVPIIVRKNLRNIPEEGLYTWDVLYTMPQHPEQFFFKQK